MSSIPVFILKDGLKNRRLTYSEASQIFGPEELDKMLAEVTSLVKGNKGTAKEYKVNSIQTLEITFNNRL